MRRWTGIGMAMLLAACSPKLPLSDYGDRFPVAKPFELAKAGGRVEADFELLPDPRGRSPRPVFVGFRSGGPKGRPDKKEGDTDYIRHSDIPLRVQLWRIEGQQRIPVTLLEQRLVRASDGTYPYEANTSHVFTEHGGVGVDAETLLSQRRYDMNMAYDPQEIAMISPALPGRYHLEVESLRGHPQISHLHIELLVAYFHYK